MYWYDRLRERADCRFDLFRVYLKCIDIRVYKYGQCMLSQHDVDRRYESVGWNNDFVTCLDTQRICTNVERAGAVCRGQAMPRAGQASKCFFELLGLASVSPIPLAAAQRLDQRLGFRLSGHRPTGKRFA